MYDMQRRSHLMDDDNRSAIRRGLQAAAPPWDTPPPSLPPGAPSSGLGDPSEVASRSEIASEVASEPSEVASPSEIESRSEIEYRSG